MDSHAGDNRLSSADNVMPRGVLGHLLCEERYGEDGIQRQLHEAPRDTASQHC